MGNNQSGRTSQAYWKCVLEVNIPPSPPFLCARNLKARVARSPPPHTLLPCWRIGSFRLACAPPPSLVPIPSLSPHSSPAVVSSPLRHSVFLYCFLFLLTLSTGPTLLPLPLPSCFLLAIPATPVPCASSAPLLFSDCPSRAHPAIFPCFRLPLPLCPSVLPAHLGRDEVVSHFHFPRRLPTISSRCLSPPPSRLQKQCSAPTPHTKVTVATSPIASNLWFACVSLLVVAFFFIAHSLPPSGHLPPGVQVRGTPAHWA